MLLLCYLLFHWTIMSETKSTPLDVKQELYNVYTKYAQKIATLDTVFTDMYSYAQGATENSKNKESSPVKNFITFMEMLSGDEVTTFTYLAKDRLHKEIAKYELYCFLTYLGKCINTADGAMTPEGKELFMPVLIEGDDYDYKNIVFNDDDEPIFPQKQHCQIYAKVISFDIATKSCTIVLSETHIDKVKKHIYSDFLPDDNYASITVPINLVLFKPNRIESDITFVMRFFE